MGTCLFLFRFPGLAFALVLLRLFSEGKRDLNKKAVSYIAVETTTCKTMCNCRRGSRATPPATHITSWKSQKRKERTRTTLSPKTPNEWTGTLRPKLNRKKGSMRDVRSADNLGPKKGKKVEREAFTPRRSLHRFHSPHKTCQEWAHPLHEQPSNHHWHQGLSTRHHEIERSRHQAAAPPQPTCTCPARTSS